MSRAVRWGSWVSTAWLVPNRAGAAQFSPGMVQNQGEKRILLLLK